MKTALSNGLANVFVNGLQLTVALFLLMVPSPAFGQVAGASSARGAEGELVRLEDGWARGLVRRDTIMFRRHLARNFVYTENADVMGKEDVIKGVSGPDTVSWARNEGMKVHLYGTTGVVTGILAMKGRGKSGPFDKRYRFTDTWMRLDGRWQIIAAQDYLIPR